MTRTYSILITLLLFAGASAFAQTGTIKGRVVDAMGSGILGANILAVHSHRGASVNDFTGQFVIKNLPPGPDTLLIKSVGYKTQYVPVVVYPDSEIVPEIKLEEGQVLNGFIDPYNPHIAPIAKGSFRAGIIKGRVISNKTKKPIQGAWIDSPRMREQTTNGNGEFRLSGMPVGLDTLLVGAEEHSSLRVPVSVVPDSQTTVNVELKYGGFTLKVSMACSPGKPCIYHEPFTIKPGKFTLAGLVRENEGDNRVPYAIVTTYFSYTDSDDVTRQDCCASVVADSMGRFVFQNLYPGEYDLSARRSRGAVDQDFTSLSTIADSLYRLDFRLGEKTK